MVISNHLLTLKAATMSGKLVGLDDFIERLETILSDLDVQDAEQIWPIHAAVYIDQALEVIKIQKNQNTLSPL